MSQVNRATGETMRQQATQEGLVPLKAWVKNALDHVICECMNEPGLEFVWVGDDAIDPLEQAQTLQILVGAGIKTREEARADLGLAPAAGRAPVADNAAKALRKFNPHFKLIEARQPPLKDQYDEWLARIICYAFSVPVSPFVFQVNRATGETMRQQATQEGLVPLKAWVKNALDHVIQECMNEPGLEFVLVGDDAVDPLEQAQTLQILVGAGIKTREEARADLGLAPTAQRQRRPRPWDGPQMRHPTHGGRPQRFQRLEQKANIFLTGYAGRGIDIYSGRSGAGDEGPAPFQPLQTAPSLAVMHALPHGMATGPFITFECRRFDDCLPISRTGPGGEP